MKIQNLQTNLMLKLKSIQNLLFRRKETILITSATSGVGIALLDSLRGRRKSLHIIGVCTDLTAPFTHEFDLFLKSPPTFSKDFPRFIEDLCLRHKAKLVITGRDDDLSVLGEFHDDPNSPIVLQSGPGWLVNIFRDKYLAHNWCVERNIEFAPSVSTDDPNLEEKLNSLISKSGFPLILKPRRGDGSRGIFVLRDSEDVANAISLSDHVIQSFMGTMPSDNLEPDLDFGIPLFWNFPEVPQGVIVFVIDSLNRTGQFFTCLALHSQGIVRNMRALNDPDLTNLASRILRELVSVGFHGVCGFSVMKSKKGVWHTIEINSRFSGGTSSRKLLGFDEVAKTLNLFFPKEIVKPLSKKSLVWNQINRMPRDLTPNTK
jgi:hypothetical protein